MPISKKISKRIADAAAPGPARYIIWDADLKGFGLRVEVSGSKTYLVRYRPKGGGASAPKRFVTIGRHGVVTADEARARAKEILGAVAIGADPAGERFRRKTSPTIAALFEDYDRLHISVKLKASTAISYRSLYRVYVEKEWGGQKAEDLSRRDVTRFHAKWAAHRTSANRVVSMLSAMFEWACEHGYLPEGTNPIRGVEKYAERRHERYLSAEELVRLGAAIREAETIGIPWSVDEERPTAKHAPKPERRRTPMSPQAAAALRLLLFTGGRLREILNLRWEWVDFERQALFLPDSKTGRKTIYLNMPALAVLQSLPRLGRFVFPGEPRPDGKQGAKAFESGGVGRPRWDLNRPWKGIRRMASLPDVRLHDLRHTHASFGVGGGLGLPVIAKLLGHARIETTQRYAHLDADPIRRASQNIGQQIAAALGEAPSAPAAEVVSIRRK
jgi:integrase